MPEQRWQRIIPVAFIMYTIAFVDRTNISLALPAMSRSLHMNPAQAGSAAGVFFWGYLLLQIPAGYLAEHWSAKRFIAILLVLWGATAVACGLVRSWRELWFMRLLLGVTEGGVWPAVLVLLSHWFPRQERARANAYWMLCLPAAVVISSPLSGWILGRWGWRVMLISEGALPFVWLVLWLLFIDDRPCQARWISAEERSYLETTLGAEAATLETSERPSILRALAHPQVLLLIAIYCLETSGNYGYLFWLPSALHHARHLSNLTVGFLFSVPYLITAVGMVVNSKHSDRTQERRLHVASGLAWGGVFLLLGILLSSSFPLLSFAAIAMVGAGSYGMLGPFWAIPTETLPVSVSGSAMGLINALGNLGGFFGPLMVGYLDKQTGNFTAAFGVLGLGFLAGAALSLLCRRQPRHALAGQPST